MSNSSGKEKGGECGRVPAVSGKPVFRLYISGATPKSTQAIVNLKRVLNSLFDKRYELAVIDIYQEPHKAEALQVRAVPQLIKEKPLPAMSFFGDFSSTQRILRMLGVGNQYGSRGKPNGKQNRE